MSKGGGVRYGSSDLRLFGGAASDGQQGEDMKLEDVRANLSRAQRAAGGITSTPIPTIANAPSSATRPR
jgi:hypothetical protein